MYKDVLKKYLQNFKLFVPFILVKLAYEITTFEATNSTIGTDKYSVITQGAAHPGNVGTSILNNIVMLLITLFAAPLFYGFLQLVIKSIIKEKEVSYKESFRESLRFYLRYLGLTIIIIAIIIGILLLSIFAIALPIILIGVFILLIYVIITIAPCESYLIYHDTSPEEALSKGRVLGKKYFWYILLVSLISGVITFIMKIKPSTGLLTYSIVTLITTIIEFYMSVFTMDICRKEDPILEDSGQLTIDN